MPFAVTPLRRRLPLAALVLAVALAAGLFTAGDAAAARVKCPGTFRVLHDDHVGNLSLPRGNYAITTLASGRPGCAAASRLFTRFLLDYDGRLPGTWRVSVANSAFVRAPGVGFHVRRVRRSGGGAGDGGTGAGGGGIHPAPGRRFCPTFRVLHNDRIGRLRLRRGSYWIVLLQRRGLTCGQASALFTRFLEDFNGRLPRPWIMNPERAIFRRGKGGIGFRVKPVSRRPQTR